MSRKAAAAVTASFDKASYTPGDVMTLTCTRPMGSVDTTVNFGGSTATAHAALVVPGSVVDAGGRTFAVKSDDGTTAVYTATA